MTAPEAQIEHHSNLSEAFYLPVHAVRGLGRIAARVGNSFRGHEEVSVEHKIVPANGFNHLVLISEPDSEYGIHPSEATNEVMLPGLTEMCDAGSAYNWHQAVASEHRDRRIITIASDGVSKRGEILPLSETLTRSFGRMAYERLELMRKLTNDGPINLGGISKGTALSMHIAAQNLCLDSHRQVNIERLKLVASAVIACEVDAEESFHDFENDQEMRDSLTQEFFMHIPGDLLNMLRKHPAETLRCAPIIGEYALNPLKAPSRGLIIHRALKNVQQGIRWDEMKNIADEYEILVLGGETDPLTQAQIAQWDKLAELYPGKVRQEIREGYGHCMTIDARGTANKLAELELAHEDDTAYAFDTVQSRAA